MAEETPTDSGRISLMLIHGAWLSARVTRVRAWQTLPSSCKIGPNCRQSIKDNGGQRTQQSVCGGGL